MTFGGVPSFVFHRFAEWNLAAPVVSSRKQRPRQPGTGTYEAVRTRKLMSVLLVADAAMQAVN
jgi:hypothetical protein